MERLKSLTLNTIIKQLLILDRTADAITSDQLRLPPSLISLIRRKLSAVEDWLKQHGQLIPNPKRFIDDVCWYDCGPGLRPAIDRSNTILRILYRRKSQLSACERFELSAVYCLKEEAFAAWRELDQHQQQKYLAERVQQYDPVVIFWTGICAGQHWLSDSYLVRAFYWAAEHDYLEALEYFWEHIVQERADAVTFRAVRAFQLAACRGHLQTLVLLWTATDEEQHRLMIQGTLTYTQGALYAFESACKEGHYELVKFIFQEADYQQRVIILRAEECRAFRLAAEGGHLEVLRLFFEKSQRMKLKKYLLEAENCYAFRRALANGHEAAVELIWSYADSDDDRRMLLNAALYSNDVEEMPETTRIINYLWKNSHIDMRSAIFSRYIVPKVAKQFCAEARQRSRAGSTSPREATPDVPLTMNDLRVAGESTFFAVCEMQDAEQVQTHVKEKLGREYRETYN